MEVIFYTTDGYTQTPNETDIENLQVLGIESGTNKIDALNNLLDNNSWILEDGYELCNVTSKIIIDYSTRNDIKSLIKYIKDNIFLNNIADNKINDIIKRLSNI